MASVSFLQLKLHVCGDLATVTKKCLLKALSKHEISNKFKPLLPARVSSNWHEPCLYERE